MEIRVPVSIGEIFDKISVLDIKARRFEAELGLHSELNIALSNAFANVKRERKELLQIVEHLWSKETQVLFEELEETNEIIWDAVDELHIYDKKFFRNPWKIASLARTIYVENDRRAAIKRQINILLNSEIIEEKVYR